MTLTSKLPATRRTQRIALVALCLVVALGTTTSAVALRINVAVPALAQQGSTQSGSAPTRVSGGIMAGQVRSKVVPIYPQEAKQAHISGAVVLRAVIGKDGTVQSLTAISGPPELQSSAITAVRQWIYEPYLLNGTPTEVETKVTVTYSMQ
jgi:TonB family protein